jgi:hypothetical protein
MHQKQPPAKVAFISFPSNSIPFLFPGEFFMVSMGFFGKSHAKFFYHLRGTWNSRAISAISCNLLLTR